VEEPHAPIALIGMGALATPTNLAPLWSRIIRTPGLSPILRAILTNSSLTSLEGGKATIVCTPKFASGAPKWTTQMADLISREHGAKVEIIIRAAADGESIAPRAADAPPASDGSPDATSDADSPPASSSDSPAPRTGGSQPTDHPLVKQALEVFGGRIVDVQPRRRG
jgi:hypothetical protein